MTPEQIEQSRRRFEAWTLRENPGEFLGRLDNGEYADLVVRSNWRVWLAAQSDADAGHAVLARAYLHRDAGDGWHIEPERDPHCDRCTEVVIVRADAVEGVAQ